MNITHFVDKGSDKGSAERQFFHHSLNPNVVCCGEKRLRCVFRIHLALNVIFKMLK